MPWLLVLVAGLLETCWAVGLKYTQGFTRPWPSLFVAVTLISSLALLSIAMRTLPAGTAYAVWVGIGALGAALVGIVLFREPATLGRFFFLGLMVASIVGLKFTSGGDAH